jgi:nucleoside 2-deoxyribosyltransferase
VRSRIKSQIVYISGPITNKLYPSAQFEQAASWLKNDGHQVFNPMDIPHPSEKDEDCSTKEETWSYYMREAIQMLAQADCIYMLEGWETSKGARLEFNLATSLNIPVYYAHEDYKYV